MPGERISDSKTGLEYSAYLIEARSIGGLSGSPVFAYLGPSRVAPDGKLNLSMRAIFLIGVVRGHWEHKEIGTASSAFQDELDRINWGIAAVTPATELEDIIMGNDLNQWRERRNNELAAAQSNRESPTGDLL